MLTPAAFRDAFAPAKCGGNYDSYLSFCSLGVRLRMLYIKCHSKSDGKNNSNCRNWTLLESFGDCRLRFRLCKWPFGGQKYCIFCGTRQIFWGTKTRLTKLQRHKGLNCATQQKIILMLCCVIYPSVIILRVIYPSVIILSVILLSVLKQSAIILIVIIVGVAE